MFKLAASAAILFVIFSQGTIMATSRTPTAGQPIQVGSDQLAQLAQLLPAIFGSKQTATSSPGDTAALQQLIQQLQGADYAKTLQSVFQQAGGQIPGLQAAFSNAVGARSGSNSAVAASLQRLMQETTLAGQKQLAEQQLQNQQIQANAGQSIAAATKGTTQTQKAPGAINQLTGLLGLVQAARMATGSKDIEELGRKLGLGQGGRTEAVAPITGAVGMTPGAVVGGDAFMPGALAGGEGITSADNSAFLDSLAPFLSGGSIPVAGDAFMPGAMGPGGGNMGSVPFDFGTGNVMGDAFQPGMDYGSGGFGGGLGPEFDQYLSGGFDGGFDAGYIDPMSFY